MNETSKELKGLGYSWQNTYNKNTRQETLNKEFEKAFGKGGKNLNDHSNKINTVEFDLSNQIEHTQNITIPKVEHKVNEIYNDKDLNDRKISDRENQKNEYILEYKDYVNKNSGIQKSNDLKWEIHEEINEEEPIDMKNLEPSVGNQEWVEYQTIYDNHNKL
jgi:hypothetical protein